MKVHHIGVACKDIEETISKFGKYHNIIDKSDVVFDPMQNASLCMVKSDCGVDYEFISGEKVKNMVNKGMTYYHVCYEVSDIDDTYKDMCNAGAVGISQPQPAVLFGGKKVAFLFASYGLVELKEE